MGNKTAERSPAMDVIRCTALACVSSVHFFSRIGYYYVPLTGPRMYLMTVMRTAFMVCVPLFLLLSGYLCRKHRPCAAYYAKLGRILGVYALAVLTGILFHRIRSGTVISAAEGLRRLLDYSGSDYGWYVEMYLGLFLLIPYLNILYEGLGTERARRGLILTLLLMTALPPVINVYDLTNPGWWSAPGLKTGTYFQILPDWWTNLYPLTYYFLGAYLRDHPLKLRRWMILGLLVLATAADGAYEIWRCRDGLFQWGAWQNNPSLFLLIRSVLLFSWLQSANYSWMRSGLRRLLAKLSVWSFGAYLVSWIFDTLVYARLNAYVPDVHLRLEWFPVAVPAVLLGSLLTAACLEGICSLLSAVARRFLFRRPKA